MSTALSIIIPAFDAATTLPRVLKKLIDSKGERDEIIVVDDCSFDQTPELLEQYPIKVIRMESNHGQGFCRNVGAEAANNDVLVFIDSDIEVYADSLQKIKNHFGQNPKTDALTGKLSLEHPYTSFFFQL